MALIEEWMPPTRQNWELLVFYFQFFPLVRLTTHFRHKRDPYVLPGHCPYVDSTMVWSRQDIRSYIIRSARQVGLDYDGGPRFPYLALRDEHAARRA
jgi:hypothetical protein